MTTDAGPPSALAHAKRLARAARGAGRYGQFLLPGPAALAYIGWTGHGNLGDESMYVAHRHLLRRRLVPVPEGDTAGLARLLHRGGRVGGIVLGGGTLIYNGHFRRMLEGLVEACPDAPRVMLGVGVEDPSYTTGRRQATADEIAPWRTLLAGFDDVRVRGPLSRASLAAGGVLAEVSGDPALALPLTPSSEGAVPRKRIGVNIGVTDDLWGSDEKTLFTSVIELCRRLLGDGWAVQLLTTTADDTATLRRVEQELAHPAVHGPNDVDLPSLMRALSTCSVLVAEKLHAVVLGARVGVPGIALEYRPKCRDFQESVARGAYVVRTDEVEVSSLAAMVEEVEGNRTRQSRDLHGAVHERSDLLTAAAQIVSDRLSS